MRNRRNIIVGITAIAIVILAAIGYNVYRHPASFRNLSDNSLPEDQVEDYDIVFIGYLACPASFTTQITQSGQFFAGRFASPPQQCAPHRRLV